MSATWHALPDPDEYDDHGKDDDLGPEGMAAGERDGDVLARVDLEFPGREVRVEIGTGPPHLDRRAAAALLRVLLRAARPAEHTGAADQRPDPQQPCDQPQPSD
jgi:hypothetical protein